LLPSFWYEITLFVYSFSVESEQMHTSNIEEDYDAKEEEEEEYVNSHFCWNLYVIGDYILHLTLNIIKQKITYIFKFRQNYIYLRLEEVCVFVCWFSESVCHGGFHLCDLLLNCFVGHDFLFTSIDLIGWVCICVCPFGFILNLFI
jgi:hypothetical protein